MSGGHAASAVVCGTLADFEKREDMISGHPSGCRKFPSGTKVVLKGLMYDPNSASSGGPSMPIAKIVVIKDKFAGYIPLENGVIPKIPARIEISLRSNGKIAFSLSSSQTNIFSKGPKFHKIKVEVVRQSEHIGANGRDLYVRILRGPFKGRAGWIFSTDVEGPKGNPFDEFAFALLSSHGKIPKAYLLKGTPPSLSVALSDEGSVPPFGVARGRPDFQHFVDYYAKGNYAAGAAVHCGLKSKSWGKRVMRGSLLMLSARSSYDFALISSSKVQSIVNDAASQLDKSITAGLHSPFSICVNLQSTPGYFLAKSLATMSREGIN